MSEPGYEKGDVCGRNGCTGIIREHEDSERGCSCHINPPCSYCTTAHEYCPVCDWDGEEEQAEYEQQIAARTKAQRQTWYQPRTVRSLDPTKIDFIRKGHTNASMKVEGVYPPNTAIEEVEKLVRGTFGGRFEQFGGGRFVYIAYTD